MIDEILKKIAAYKTIIVIRHKNPDPDAIGSQIGLVDALKTAYPQKQILAAGGDLPIFDWIGKMDTVSNIQYKGALAIIVDTANTERIDDNNDYRQVQEMIKIDHHPNVDDFGDIAWIDENYSSCAEMIYELIDQSDDLTITKTIAEKLYAGIIGDTNRFLYGETNARTLRIASSLANTGIDLSKIGHHEDEISLDIARLEAYVLENFTITDSGFAYVIIDKDTLDIFNLAPGEIDSVVPIIGKISDVNTWAFISEREKDKFRVNLRSKTIAINPIAEKFGGGGHPLASGVFVHGKDQVDNLLQQMDKITK